MLNTFRFMIFVVCLLVAPVAAHAWGQYGHEQVNSAAIDLIPQNTSLAACFRDARPLVTRYAITPDVEWKTDLFLKTLSAADSRKRFGNDCYEHPLHFFEADAYVKAPGTIATLPTSGNFGKIGYPLYAKLLRNNLAHVIAVDPSKKIKNPHAPSPLDVALHGTAPWRVRSLYLAAIKSMRAGDFRLATLQLATLGHYVGDMSQPFHASLNYDGQYKTSDHQIGIHHEIDTGLFDRLPNLKKDATSVFDNFEPTKTKVMEAAATYQQAHPEAVGEAEIVPSVIGIVDSGSHLVATLLHSYKTQCDQANSTNTPMTTPNPSTTPSPTATPLEPTPEPVASAAPLATPGSDAIPNATPIIETTPVATPNASPGPAVTATPVAANAGKTINARTPASREQLTDAQIETLNNQIEDHSHLPILPDTKAARAPVAKGIPYCVNIPDGKRGRVRAIGTRREDLMSADVLAGEGKVIEVLEERLGISAALLAKLWTSAYEAAGSPTFPDCKTPDWSFSQSYAIQNYPKPDYYPHGFDGVTQDGCK